MRPSYPEGKEHGEEHPSRQPAADNVPTVEEKQDHDGYGETT